MESKKNKLQKKNGKWKKTEHSRFLRALQKYGKNWIQVQEYVKTRTLEQVRSHAQKMFISMSEEQKKQFQKQQLRREKQLCQVRNWKLDGKNLEKNSEVSVILPIQISEVCQKEQNEPMLKMEDEKNQSQSTPSVCEFIKPASLEFHSPNQYSYFFTTLISNYHKFGNQEEFFNNFSFLPVSANPLSNSKQGIF